MNSQELTRLATELAFANVAIAHAERFMAEQRNGFVRAQVAMERIDGILERTPT